MRWLSFGYVALRLGHAARSNSRHRRPTTRARRSSRRRATAPAVETALRPPPGTAPPSTSLPEPKGPIDPKSVEAAGQVVQHYGALIEQRRLDEAARYWGDAGAAAKFAQQLKPSTCTSKSATSARPKGPPGSIYTTVPVVLYGSGSFRRPASVILRRVNDVPGSTQAQRRWHIERIEWADAG